MFYASNERHHSSLSIDVFNSENRYKVLILFAKYHNFVIILSIVHISTNNVLNNPKCCVVVDYIHLEGNLSQNFLLGLGFYFMSKNGWISHYFF